MVKHTQARARLRLLPWIVWAIAATFFLFNYMNQVVPTAMADELSDGFHINATMLGILAAVYFYTYAAMQIPAGIIVDHFGPHRSLAVAAILATLGCLGFAWSSSYGLAMGTRMLVGAGASFSFIASLKLIANWFTDKQFGTLTGLTNIVGMIGAVVGVGLLTGMTQDIGWRETATILGGAGAVLALLILFLVGDHPASAVVKEETETQRDRIVQAFKHIRVVFSVGQNWINGFYAATINAPFIALGALWGSKYLQVHYDLPKPTAAFISSMIFMGAIPGSFFFGWFSDRIKRRKLPMIVGGIGSVCAISLQLYIPDLPLAAAYGSFFLLGFFCSANVVSYALAHDLCPPHVIGVAVGFVSTFLYGFGALLDPLIGWLMDQHTTHATHGGGLHYTRDDFTFALSSLTICLALSVLAAFLVRETRCKKRTL